MVDAPALAASTIAALEQANMPKTVLLVKERLLQHRLCDDDGEMFPMIELLLFEIRDIARRPHLNTVDRVQLVYNALVLAGC